MHSPIFLSLFLFNFFLSSFPGPIVAEESPDPSDGWNANVKWVADWDTAVKQARDENKPLMLLIHRKWCGACKNLKPKFAASAEIAAKSYQAVMIQSADEAEFTEDLFSPDGGYVPRILFFEVPAEGEPVFMDKITQREDQYKYFHYDPSSIVKSMNDAFNIVRKPEIIEEFVEKAEEASDEGKTEL